MRTNESGIQRMRRSAAMVMLQVRKTAEEAATSRGPAPHGIRQVSGLVRARRTPRWGWWRRV